MDKNMSCYNGIRYDLDVPIPNAPWALLNRTYGDDCRFMVRMNEHDGAGPFDVRLPENAHLLHPANVDTSVPFIS